MLWDIIKTHEHGNQLEYPECVALNKPIDEALLIADRFRIGWERDVYRIKASPEKMENVR